VLSAIETAAIESASGVEYEDPLVTGWVVSVTDSESRVVRSFGPWPRDGGADAVVWADYFLEWFIDDDDDNNAPTLTIKVSPLCLPKGRVEGAGL
jgi:hypothetical protein